MPWWPLLSVKGLCQLLFHLLVIFCIWFPSTLTTFLESLLSLALSFFPFPIMNWCSILFGFYSPTGTIELSVALRLVFHRSE